MPRRTNQTQPATATGVRLLTLEEELHKQWNRRRDAEDKAKRERDIARTEQETRRRLAALERKLTHGR